MRPIHDPEAMRRIQMTFELFETGIAMMRQGLRRRFPQEDDSQIERRIVAWLQDRPGAEHGDASGPFRVRHLFE